MAPKDTKQKKDISSYVFGGLAVKHVRVTYEITEDGKALLAAMDAGEPQKEVARRLGYSMHDVWNFMHAVRPYPTDGKAVVRMTEFVAPMTNQESDEERRRKQAFKNSIKTRPKEK